MNTTLLLLGIAPLIVFVLVDTFANLKAALIAAVLFAIIEAGFSYFILGEIDWITGLSVGLVLLLAGVSFYTKSDLHFKLQPAILSAIFGLTFLITYFSGSPLLTGIFNKYEGQLPLEHQAILQSAQFQVILDLSSHYLGYAMLAHAGLTLWAALKLSKWWWLAMRGIGFYVFMILAMFIAIFQSASMTY